MMFKDIKLDMKDVMPATLAVMIMALFSAVVITSSFKTGGIEADVKQTLFAIVMLAVGFYLGSSSDSRKKTDAMVDAAAANVTNVANATKAASSDVPKTLGALVALILSGALLMSVVPTPIYAQGAMKSLAQRNDVNAPGGIIGSVAGGPAAARRGAQPKHRGIAELKKPIGEGAPQDAAGKDADPIAAPCLAAVIPVLELISKDSVAVEGDGVVTKVIKARILRMKLQSQELQIACAPWKQDARSQILQGAKDVLGLLFGAMKFGL